MLILWVFVSVVALIVLILAGLFFMPLKVSIEFRQTNADTDGWVELSTLFGLFTRRQQIVGVKTKWTKEGPSVETQQKTDTAGKSKSVVTSKEVIHVISNWQHWLTLVQDVWHEVKHLCRQAHIHTFEWETRLGTGDEVLTGIAYGTYWTVVSGFVGRLTYLVQFHVPPKVSVDADFHQPVFTTRLVCIGRVSFGYATLVALRIARVWRRRTTDGASNPGTYENGHGKHPRNGRREYNYRRSG